MVVYFNTYVFTRLPPIIKKGLSGNYDISFLWEKNNINHAQMKNKLYTNKTMADLKAFKNIANMIHWH